jgi:Na+:H+ antiporter, NhaA family
MLRVVVPILRLTAALERFLRVESAGGIALLACAAAALALANSPLAERFLALWSAQLFEHSLRHWINDGLMAVFFFVIGLEVKRELAIGELRDPRRAALPVAGAIGGMLVPAGIYLALQGGGPAAAGWGVPMATDIAFAAGCLSLLGERVPPALRVFLLSLAIADDLGAIIVIAVGYTDAIDLRALALGLAGFAGVAALARAGVRSFAVYTLVGAGIWLAFHESGVHATLAGVGLGLLTPARAEEGGASPLETLEHALHPWVSFGIMPLFALANAGVPVALGAFMDPVALAVAAGLVLGKPLGITAFAWVALRLRIAAVSAEIDYGVMLGAGALAGIGFTMALFIAGLALEGPALDAAKLGTLAGSLVAAALGMTLLAWRLPPKEALPAARPEA